MDFYINVFHKCGSNWFRPVFKNIAKCTSGHYFPHTKNSFGINSPVSFGEEHVFNVFPGGNIKKVQRLTENLNSSNLILCVRDPRDALVSQFFSWRNSHRNNTNSILQYRERFQQMSPVEGMKTIVNENVFVFANQMLPWSQEIFSVPVHERNFKIVKYEELQSDFIGTIQRLSTFFDLQLSLVDIESIEKTNRFDKKAKREKGQEDQYSHYRKGIVGDYMNYFDSELRELFDEKYGWLVELLDYDSRK